MTRIGAHWLRRSRNVEDWDVVDAVTYSPYEANPADCSAVHALFRRFSWATFATQYRIRQHSSQIRLVTRHCAAGLREPLNLALNNSLGGCERNEGLSSDGRPGAGRFFLGDAVGVVRSGSRSFAAAAQCLTLSFSDNRGCRRDVAVRAGTHVVGRQGRERNRAPRSIPHR